MTWFFVAGAFLGTRILIAVPERAIYLALAAVILVFLAGARLHLDLTIPPRWEGRLGAITGLVGGTLNFAPCPRHVARR
jgi:uncharacterized membrane protein YfcA